MNRKKLIIAAVVLILILAIGGALAFFTDTETKTNTFTTSKTKITVTEENFPPPGTPPGGNVVIVPGQVIAKDPVVTNVGQGKVYAFAEVTIPKANVKAGEDTTPSLRALFKTNYISTPADNTTTPPTEAVYEEGFNKEWILISRPIDNDAVAAQGETPAKPASVTYQLAYATKDEEGHIILTKLDEGASTPALFDSVKMIEVNEDDPDSENSVQAKDFDIVVSGYGIQVEGLDTTDVMTIFNHAKTGN